jgi:hypothetical protein
MLESNPVFVDGLGRILTSQNQPKLIGGQGFRKVDVPNSRATSSGVSSPALLPVGAKAVAPEVGNLA